MANSILNIKVYTFVELGHDIWFIPQEYNALCRYNKRKKSIDYMSAVPKEEQRPTLYSKIVIYEKYLVLVPYMASEIAIFDMEKKQFIKIQLPIPDACYKYRESVKFHNGIRKGKLIYLLPGEFPEIVCINMENLKLVTVNIWYPLYNGIFYDKEKVVGAYKGIDNLFCSDGKELYITFYAGEKGKLGKFSFDTREMRIYTIDGADTYFSCMEMYGDDLYLVARSGQIFCWNRHERKVTAKYFCKGDSNGIRRESIPYEIFVRSILHGNNMYLFWADKPQYTKFDLVTHEMETKKFRYINKPVCEIDLLEEKGYLFTNESNIFYQIENGKVEKISFEIEIGLLQRYFSEGYFQKKIYFEESCFFDLKKMFPVLLEDKEEKALENTNIGKTIYCL